MKNCARLQLGPQFKAECAALIYVHTNESADKYDIPPLFQSYSKYLYFDTIIIKQANSDPLCENEIIYSSAYNSLIYF